jgi:membrane fusion protein, multidrug efflux system
VHPGQYLDAGTALTTLQAVGGAVHIDFAVPQSVASSLRRGTRVRVNDAAAEPPQLAEIIAIDSRVNPETRNAMVRARLDGAARDLPSPGASMQVTVPTGPPQPTLVVPATALRKSPEGDQVFVVSTAGDGQLRAEARRVETGALVGDNVLVRTGLAAGEKVATSGSFKLRDGMRVVVSDNVATTARK